MKTGEWSDADCYRIACDCHHHDHDVDVWIEVQSDDEVKEVTVTFYREFTTPIWERGFNRFREAFRVLFFGYSRYSGDIIMSRDVAQNFIRVVQSSIDRLEQKK